LAVYMLSRDANCRALWEKKATFPFFVVGDEYINRLLLFR